jgi:hypothetical protein
VFSVRYELNLYIQWNLELRTQSVPGDGSTFELNVPIRNNVK